MLDIIKLTKNLVVVNKPAGVPSQSDASGDKDAITLTAEELVRRGENSSLWLVHRLDRTVGGLMVLARNAKYAALLSELVSTSGFAKTYLAVVEGHAEGGELVDYLYKDARIGKSLVVSASRSGAKRAVLSYKALGEYRDCGRIYTANTRECENKAIDPAPLSRLPYFLSPTIGNPMLESCALIW